MCREDMIDFPCSDTWLDHYYDRGMTQRHSPRRWEAQEIRLNTLEEYLRELKSLVRGKKVIVQNLVTPVLPKKQKKFTVYEPEELHEKREV